MLDFLRSRVLQTCDAVNFGHQGKLPAHLKILREGTSKEAAEFFEANGAPAFERCQIFCALAAWHTAQVGHRESRPPSAAPDAARKWVQMDTPIAGVIWRSQSHASSCVLADQCAPFY